MRSIFVTQSSLDTVADAIRSTRMNIPPRFKNSVRSYLFQFHARLVEKSFPAPALFVLIGPPGEGKSTMVSDVLSGIGVPVKRLSASALGGMYEGDSTTPIIDAYLALGSREDLLPAPAIVLDDFDLSAGRVDQRNAGTINQSLLNGLLMNIADKPDQLTKSYIDETGTPRSRTFDVKPVMIILTANDGTQIYPPLLRPGRALVSEWRATPDDMAEMLAGIFPSLSESERRDLVARFPGAAIAFFNQINSEMVRSRLESATSAVADQALSSKAAMLSLVRDLQSARTNLSFGDVLARANSLWATRSAITNHIDSTGGRNHAHSGYSRKA